MSESLISDPQEMVEALIGAWSRISDDEPVALFGHSMGGLLAHEVALALAEVRPRALTHLFISGRTPPNITNRAPRLYHLPDAELLEAVALRHGMLAPEILADEEIKAIVSAVLRADFTILDTYTWSPKPSLDIPLTIFAGNADEWMGPQDLAHWHSYTTGTCRIETVEGNHFFHQSNSSEVIRRICNALNAPERADKSQPEK